MDKSLTQKVKLLMIGDSGVGKSSLVLRFAENSFSLNLMANVGLDLKTKLLDIDGKKVTCEIWDTAGQENFHNLTKKYFEKVMGVVMVYDVNDRKSFENVNPWLQSILENTEINEKQFVEKEIIVVLVGNKIDLPDRKIEFSEAEEISKKYNIKYFETSAKSSINVNEFFDVIVKQIISNPELMKKKGADGNKCLKNNIIKKNTCCNLF